MTDNLTAQQRSQCMSHIRSKGMKPERIVRSLVHRMGFRFRLHDRNLPGKPDLVFRRFRAVIFVHGCFWHWHPRADCPIAGLPKSNRDYWRPKLSGTRARDVEHTRSLRQLGWKVLVVWECELVDKEAIQNRITSFLHRGVAEDLQQSRLATSGRLS